MHPWSELLTLSVERGCFRGCRRPVKALFENLEDGARIDEFLSWFPGVQRQQVEAVLEHAGNSLAETA